MTTLQYGLEVLVQEARSELPWPHPIKPPTSAHPTLQFAPTSTMNTTPIHPPTSNYVLVRPHGVDRTKHVRGVPNPEGGRPTQFLFSAAPLPQGRPARGTDERGRDFDAGQQVRVLNSDGRYVDGEVAYTARSCDKVFVWVEGVKVPVVNDPEFIVSRQ